MAAKRKSSLKRTKPKRASSQEAPVMIEQPPPEVPSRDWFDIILDIVEQLETGHLRLMAGEKDVTEQWREWLKAASCLKGKLVGVLNNLNRSKICVVAGPSGSAAEAAAAAVALGEQGQPQSLLNLLCAR